MPTVVWIVIAITVLIVIGLATYLAVGRGRTVSLRSRFGHEYDRTVEATGDQREAERELTRGRNGDGSSIFASWSPLSSLNTPSGGGQSRPGSSTSPPRPSLTRMAWSPRS
jgi:hypothetical protein